MLPLLLLAALPAVHCGSPWGPAPRARAAAAVAKLSLDEQVAIMSALNAGYGTPTAISAYVGYTPGVPSAGIPPLLWEDGPQGVADGQLGVTAWPSAMTVAQAWRPDLFERWGAAMGGEQRGKGSNVMLGPAVALVRVPLSGRVFEYYSEDPVLSSALSGAMVRGIQSQNVSACVKHWIFNSQELHRGDARGSPGMSSNVPQRAGRELYAPPYAAAVDAGVGTVMCSFNRINNTYSCEQGDSLAGWLLAPESAGGLGFDGAVVSDWTATHSTAASALAGLSVEQEWQRNASFYGANLSAAVAAGEVPAARVAALAQRVLLALYATTDAADAPPDPSRNISANVTSAAAGALARELAVAGTVLLANGAGLLPLEAATLCRIVIAGDPADTIAGGGSGGVAPPYVVSPAAGLQAQLPRTTIITLDGANASAAAAAAANADVAIVIVGERTSEGMDRATLALPPGQDALVAAVAAANPRTIVVARCPGACLMPWAPAVGAIVSQLYAGQEAGNALADVLLGAASPAGKLTVSWPRTDNDTWLSAPGGGPVLPERYPGTDRGRGYPEVDYAEGLFVGYRHYDAQPSTPPLFPFGHGLSYTNFTFADLAVSGAVSAAGGVARVSFTVTNDAAVGVAGAEVAQLYVGGPPGDPLRALKGFAHTGVLAPGAAVNVTLPLAARDLSVWSVQAQAWAIVPSGSYPLWVGASSRDLRLAGAVTVL